MSMKRHLSYKSVILTDVRIKIIEMLKAGKSRRAIAKALDVREDTVRRQIATLKKARVVGDYNTKTSKYRIRARKIELGRTIKV